MTKLTLAGISLAAMAMAGNLFALEADIDGATPGKWTMDLEAAKQVAAEKKLPILLDFSGSDWCSWCQLMESSVFTQTNWQAYASDNLMMVLVDFPNDKSLVPEKYVARNDSLNSQYGIEGFPTFVILDDDGKTELGRLQAGRDKTPESFIAELKLLFANRPAELAKFKSSLSEEGQKEFQALADKLDSTKQELEQQIKAIADANAKAESLQEAIVKLEEDIKEFRIAQQNPEKLNEYKELKAKFEAATKKLSDWIDTKPEHSEENIALYQEMVSDIQALETELSKF